jgi:hypothetical protein
MKMAKTEKAAEDFSAAFFLKKITNQPSPKLTWLSRGQLE